MYRPFADTVRMIGAVAELRVYQVALSCRLFLQVGWELSVYKILCAKLDPH